MSNTMIVSLVQLTVGTDVSQNLKKMCQYLRDASPGEWVIFPEAMLSGYAPQRSDYLADVSQDDIERSIEYLANLCQERACICVFGTAFFSNDKWFNSVFVHDGSDSNAVSRLIHSKKELSLLDQKHFAEGKGAETNGVNDINFGIQACRELLFANTWNTLRKNGAQIIFHLNNAVKEKDAVWEHLLIARAVENNCFVCSVNNASGPKHSLGSYLISPNGNQLITIPAGREASQSMTINLDEVTSLTHRSDF